jgi:uncharacterized repeat protein (TIGR04138 family)
MKGVDFNKALEEILREDARYDRDAYFFVREGLDHTIKRFKRTSTSPHRHVTGRELLEGIRQFTLEQYGPLSRTVLEHWGIKRCEDIGEIVFHMVEKGVLSKTEQDTKDDFTGGYDFEEAFEKPFRPTRPGRLSARPPSSSRMNPSGESSQNPRKSLGRENQSDSSKS